MTKEELLKKLNDVEVERIKIIGKLELLEEQEAEKVAKETTAKKETE